MFYVIRTYMLIFVDVTGNELMKNTHYGYIDALRGYAILLVMAVHASQAAVEWGG